MLIDLTSMAADVQADEQSILVTTDMNIDREGGDLDLLETQRSGGGKGGRSEWLKCLMKKTIEKKCSYFDSI